MKRLAAIALLALLALVAAPAYAGILIRNNGTVFIGQIEPGDVKEKTITVRRPRLVPGGEPAPGSQTFDRSEVRWFDEKADYPTDAYFDLHLDEPLDTRWARYAEDYRVRHSEPPLPPTGVIRSRLALGFSRDWKGCTTSLRQPLQWNVVEPRSEDGILVVESPDKRARIHVFAGAVGGERALALTRATLERLGTRIETTTVTGPAHEWVTSLTRNGRTLHALRRIVPGAKTTAFVTAYADERDWPAMLSLLRESLDTFRTSEK